MARRNNRNQGPGPSAAGGSWETERSLAAAEEEQGFEQSGEDVTCPCGSREFLLQAFCQVVDGVVQRELVEVEQLTCPHCGREFEAVDTGEGRIQRGEYLGTTDLDE